MLKELKAQFLKINPSSETLISSLGDAARSLLPCKGTWVEYSPILNSDQLFLDGTSP
jgi:hypothetical protein